MSDEPKPVPIHEIEDPDDRLAAFFKWAADYRAEQEAKNPSPKPPPKPWVDKPGTLIAAEKGLWHLEMSQKIQVWLCEEPDRCQDRRCRRTRRCRDLDAIAKGIEAARAHLAAELAKWQPLPAPPDPPRGRKKGRTGVRP